MNRLSTFHRLAMTGFAVLVAGGFAQTVGADSFTLLPGVANGLSPDGKIVVGSKPSGFNDNAIFSSFVYSADNGEVEWLTQFSEDEPEKGGLFNGVTDNRIIVGAIKNLDLRLPEENNSEFRPKRVASAENTGLPTTVAAVWRDGKLHVLDMGSWNLVDFEDTLDGTYATGVSPDGAVVVGYIRAGWYIQTPCYWYWDAEKEEYIFGLFPLGDNCPVGQPLAFSPATAVTVGTVSCMNGGEGADVVANIWAGPDQTAIIPVPQIETPYYATQASAISMDGRYVGVSATGPVCYVGIWDRQEDRYYRIPVSTDITAGQVLAITDDGSAFVRCRIDGNWISYYYDLKSETLVLQNYYFNDVAPTIANQLASIVITAVTGDGKTIIGSNGSSSYIVQLDNPQMLTIAAPTNVVLTHTAPGVLSLTWDGVTEVPEGTILKGYKARIGLEEKFYAATEPGSTFEWILEGVERGGHIANVFTVFEKRGEEFLSPISETVTSYASEETSDLLLETFDDSLQFGEMNFILNNDYWTINAEGPGKNEVIRWFLSLEDFDNRSLVMQMYGVSNQEWKCNLLSRFLATPADQEVINFSMRYKRRAVSYAGQDFANDWLDIEITTDGKTWTPIKRINGNAAKEGTWSSVFVEIPKPEAAYYRLRVSAKGSGLTHLMWLVDDLSINYPMNTEAPTGLRVLNKDEEKGITLGWHNELGLHQISYLENSPIVWDYNVGNEGKPMLVAVDFKDELTAPFAGEYFCGLSSFLFDDPELARIKSTSAEGILYADGVEVARAQIFSDFQQVTSATAWFDTPVKIEPGKTYRAAVRIYDYPTEQAPIYYQAGLSMKPGVTDLYSEDEGATWNSASPVVDDGLGRGNVIWPIRLIISEDEEATSHEDFQNWVVYTTIYRNGEPLDEVNYFEPHPYAIDANPLEEADYTLRQYTVDGRASELSEPLHVKLSTVSEIFEEVNASFTLDRKAGEIVAAGNVTEIILTAIDGQRVASSTSNSLSVNGKNGLHILTLKTEAGAKSFKILL